MAEPKLLDEWARRFILFHRKQHPSMMGAPEINEFLSALAVERLTKCHG